MAFKFGALFRLEHHENPRHQYQLMINLNLWPVESLSSINIPPADIPIMTSPITHCGPVMKAYDGTFYHKSLRFFHCSRCNKLTDNDWIWQDSCHYCRHKHYSPLPVFIHRCSVFTRSDSSSCLDCCVYHFATQFECWCCGKQNFFGPWAGS